MKKNLGYPLRHGEKWSTNERNEIKDSFKSGTSILDIAKNKDRTSYSIAWQLEEMKLISNKDKLAVKNGCEEIYYLEFNSSVKHVPVSRGVSINRSNYSDIDFNKILEFKEIKVCNIKPSNLLENNKINTKKVEPKLNSDSLEDSGSFFLVFIGSWLVIIILNQVLIFGACFAPYCLIAALPHTGILAGLATYFIRN